ncbi:cytochrome P450 [Streptomyces sp. I05A-00742]|uniref:cytochrome P450 n=1 Tax=Streptomyces sp. I05A-00742 TaxID=2732853 RepID=UPI00289FB7DF|nr:cytochrome P450 [Streptomyces sp. I05A-00742]
MNARCTYGVAPGALPVFGHALPLLRDPLAFLSTLPGRGDLVRIRVGPVRAVVVCDPGLTREVLRDDRTFDKGGPLYDRIREFTGNGLASCPHRDHRRQRRLLQPAFHSARMPEYAEVMTRQVTALTGAWRDGGTVDAADEMLTLSARITVAAMFGSEADDAGLARVMDDFTTVVAGIPRRALMPAPADRLPTPGNRRYDRARARLRAAIGLLITRQRSGDPGTGDLLSMLLAAGRDGPDGRGLSDTEIADQLVTFFAAGTETSGSALAWALYLLGGHPEVARRLRAEVDGVLDGAPAATFGHLPGLRLTAAVISEALRLYPPAWVLTRTTTDDTRLGGHTIPAGTAVVYSAYLLHRRPELFPDPERFVPDRWIAAPGAPQPPRTAFLPFGSGPRKCIGDVFALTEAALALATVVAGWDLRPANGRRVRPAPRLVLSPHRLPMVTVARAGGG